MTTTDLQQLLANKSWRAEFMAIDDGSLRIFLQDTNTGDCGLLAVEPVELAVPLELALTYSYQDINLELGPPPEECLILDLKTRTDPDFIKGDIPFLFGETR